VDSATAPSMLQPQGCSRAGRSMRGLADAVQLRVARLTDLGLSVCVRLWNVLPARAAAC
jgi:hypothetical protein